MTVFDQDNHLAALSDARPDPVTAAVSRARRLFPGLEVEVEADTLDQVRSAADAGADYILLDNMSLPMLREAVALVGGRSEPRPAEEFGWKRFGRSPKRCGLCLGRRVDPFRARRGSGAGFPVMTPDATILRAIRTSRDAGASGADLARALGINRAAVWSPHRGTSGP